MDKKPDIKINLEAPVPSQGVVIIGDVINGIANIIGPFSWDGAHRYCEDLHDGGEDHCCVAEIEAPPESIKPKTFYICSHCGSPEVMNDAYVNKNTGDAHTYDDEHCEDCEGECSTTEVICTPQRWEAYVEYRDACREGDVKLDAVQSYIEWCAATEASEAALRG
jgi:hypothetical protein